MERETSPQMDFLTNPEDYPSSNQVDKEIKKNLGVPEPSWQFVFIFYDKIETKYGLRYKPKISYKKMNVLKSACNLPEAAAKYKNAKDRRDYESQERIWEETISQIKKHAPELFE